MSLFKVWFLLEKQIKIILSYSKLSYCWFLFRQNITFITVTNYIRINRVLININLPLGRVPSLSSSKRTLWFLQREGHHHNSLLAHWLAWKTCHVSCYLLRVWHVWTACFSRYCSQYYKGIVLYYYISSSSLLFISLGHSIYTLMYC